MSRSIRLAVIAAAAFVTLAIAGPAFAAYKPQLTVTSTKNAPGAKTSIILGHIQTDADDATAKDIIFAPLGYGVTLNQPVNTGRS